MARFKSELYIMNNRELYKLVFRIAGTNVEIQSPFRYHGNNLREFFTPLPADCHVLFAPDEVTKSRIMDDSVSDITGWEGYLSSDVLLQKITNVLIEFNTFLIHGAAISYSGNGYLFSAPSGTGKTTHIRLWLENLPDAVVINDDKPFIRVDTGGQSPMLCGSPWGGKEGMCSNQDSPLKAIVFLRRAEKNSIRQISFKKAFLQLLQQSHHPSDPIMMRKTLDLIRRIGMSGVTFWEFDCNNYAEDCFLVSFRALTGK